MDTLETIKTMDRFGWITKEEPLSCITDKNLELDICILEAVAPYFGYYNVEPKDEIPQYLYWVLDKNYSLEDITRATLDLKSLLGEGLDIISGTVKITDETFHVIRMLNLGMYNKIKEVQSFFVSRNIQLKKGNKRIQHQMCHIHLQKFFQLEELDEGIYMEPGDKNRAYFTIPKYIDWNRFKEITTEVKFNSTLLFFDAARASYYVKGEIVEMVRVYRENLTLDNIKDIRDVYLRLMSH